jgi:hypothetical protein
MTRLKRFAEDSEEFDEEYYNKFDQVTPYHVLFKDHGNEIASFDKDGAIEYTINKIREFNEQYREDESFYKVDDDEIDKFRLAVEQNEDDSGMDVLFTIKDFLLESQGLEERLGKMNSRLKKNKRR